MFTIYDAIDSTRPAVDGDGTSWLVAFQRREAGASSAHDIVAQPVRFDPVLGTAYLPRAEVPVEQDAGDNEVRPAVAWLGGSALVLWQEEIVGTDFVRAKTVDPYSCSLCEAEYAIAPNHSPHQAAVASERGAGVDGANGALQVYVQNGTVHGQLFTAKDGNVIDLGGGCGQGGTADATCSIVGNSDFRLRLLHTHAHANAFAFVCAGRYDVQVTASCTLIPDGPTGVVLTRSTLLHGNATANVSISADPALTGTNFYTQWVMTGGDEFIDLDFSNALQIRIR